MPLLGSNLNSKDFMGVGILTKNGSGTFYTIPFVRATPRNPFNNSYPGVVNKSAYPSVKILGKRTPGFALISPAKNNWLKAAVLNDLVINNDTGGNTPDWHIMVWDPTTSLSRQWSYCKCTSVVMSQSVMGEVAVELSFLSVYGESEDPTDQFASVKLSGTYPTSWTPNGTILTSAGQMAGITDTDFYASDAAYSTDFGSNIDTGSTFNKVRSWRLGLLRAQAHTLFIDGSRSPAGVDSAMFGGTLVVEQSAMATTYVPEATPGGAYLRINKTQSSDKFRINMLLSLDDVKRDHEANQGNVVRVYSLVDLTNGGIPATIATY